MKQATGYFISLFGFIILFTSFIPAIIVSILVWDNEPINDVYEMVDKYVHKFL